MKALELYCSGRGIRPLRCIGSGKDGSVYETDAISVVKVHVRSEGYERERDAYLRFRNRGITRVANVRVPTLLGYGDTEGVIEMSIVRPPFIVDFASAWLDEPPDFPQDVIETWHDEIRGRFGDRFPDVMIVLDSLAREAGVYVLDVHPHNLKFE